MPDKTTRIIFDLGSKIRISPILNLDNKLKDNPGDLSKFAPTGESLYGYSEHNFSDPLKGGPKTEASGGLVYFENNIEEGDFESLLNILGIRRKFGKPDKNFALYLQESAEPGKDGYLTQMRVVSKFALKYAFGTLNEAEYDTFEPQEVSISEALWEFIQVERKRWGTSFLRSGEKNLSGLFGGDGHFAQEELSFGLMVENSYNSIYRIWSRAWLVTK